MRFREAAEREGQETCILLWSVDGCTYVSKNIRYRPHCKWVSCHKQQVGHCYYFYANSSECRIVTRYNSRMGTGAAES